MNKQWKQDIADIYESLPDKLKTYKNKVILKSVALDWLLLKDFGAGNGLAIDVADAIVDLEADPSEDAIVRLTGRLDSYYASRREESYVACVYFELRASW